MRVTLILTHVSADFDAAASCYAASLIYENALPVLPGSPNKNVREFLYLHSNVIKFLNEKDIDLSNVEKLVLTDIQSIDRVGSLEKELRSRHLPLVIFDHHRSHLETGPKLEAIIEDVGATTTLLVERIKDKGISLSPAEATFLALGIHEDTGSLTFKNTTSRDAKALAWLYEQGAQPDLIFRFLHSRFTPAQTDLLISLVNTGKLFNIRNKSIYFGKANSESFIDGASAVVHRLIDIFNPDFALVAITTGEKTTLIARSSDTSLDALKVLSRFNPSGHPEAAVAYVERLSTQEIFNEVSETIHKLLGPEIKIGDIMSTVVVTVKPQTRIGKVLELVKRTGHSGFPVIERQKLVGIITRREAEKAAFHNLSHAPVKGFMTRNPYTISSNATLEEAIKIMTEEGVGRLPVVENGKLVGIVTRTDILKALHGSGYYLKQKSNIKSLLLRRYQENIPEKVREILELTGFIAEELGYRAYLVGGIVRDLILGYENPDYDIVVEGSAIEVAKRLALSAGGRVDAYERFDTAVVIFPDGLKIDFATARTEYYEKPGSLPRVTKAGINSDLLRRDFTINALAMSLSRRNFGEILDVVGGLKDLQEGIIRVLHSLSFIEDPTRIIRAIRFEAKFGFKMDTATEVLAREAIEREALSTATKVRLRDEIFDLAREENFLQSILRAQELKVWEHLFPQFQFNKEKRSYLRRLARKPPHNPEIKRLSVLGILLNDFEASVIKSIGEEYRFKGREIEILLEISDLLRSKKKSFATNSEIYNYFSNFREESLLATAAILPRSSPLKKQLNLYLNRLIKIKPPITGKDLLKLGFEESPFLGDVKKLLFNLYLDGKLKNKDELINFARQMLKAK